MPASTAGGTPATTFQTRSYGLQVTLRRRLRELAPGLTPRAVLEKFGTVQMLDVHLPTTDERTVVLSRYTQPGTDVKLLLQRMKLELPAQPICSEGLNDAPLDFQTLAQCTSSNPPSRVSCASSRSTTTKR